MPHKFNYTPIYVKNQEVNDFLASFFAIIAIYFFDCDKKIGQGIKFEWKFSWEFDYNA